jgi:hypothetical protein
MTMRYQLHVVFPAALAATLDLTGAFLIPFETRPLA